MRIEHSALWVKDLETVKDFYIKYFNARANEKYVNTTENFQSYFLSFDDENQLEIMQRPDIPENKNDPVYQNIGFSHIAFSAGSKEAVLDLTERLKNDGYEVVSMPRKTGDGYFESCIFDPEKNRIEITV